MWNSGQFRKKSKFSYGWRRRPGMTFNPIIALYSGQGFLLPNLVAIGHYWAIWSLVDPGWPLCDRWSQQCINLWNEVLPTKLCCHRAFLKQLNLWWGCFENLPSNLNVKSWGVYLSHFFLPWWIPSGESPFNHLLSLMLLNLERKVCFFVFVLSK